MSRPLWLEKEEGEVDLPWWRCVIAASLVFLTAGVMSSDDWHDYEAWQIVVVILLLTVFAWSLWPNIRLEFRRRLGL